jgi:hypothetical protein
VDDSQLLAEALPDLTERTDLDTLVTDGGFGGEASDGALHEQRVTLIQVTLTQVTSDLAKYEKKGRIRPHCGSAAGRRARELQAG